MQPFPLPNALSDARRQGILRRVGKVQTRDESGDREQAYKPTGRKEATKLQQRNENGTLKNDGKGLVDVRMNQAWQSDVTLGGDVIRNTESDGVKPNLAPDDGFKQNSRYGRMEELKKIVKQFHDVGVASMNPKDMFKGMEHLLPPNFSAFSTADNTNNAKGDEEEEEEIPKWALDPKSGANLPSSTRTVKALNEPGTDIVKEKRSASNLFANTKSEKIICNKKRHASRLKEITVAV
eukprot:Gb_08593 [translate_table: standard]